MTSHNEAVRACATHDPADLPMDVVAAAEARTVEATARVARAAFDNFLQCLPALDAGGACVRLIVGAEWVRVWAATPPRLEIEYTRTF